MKYRDAFEKTFYGDKGLKRATLRKNLPEPVERGNIDINNRPIHNNPDGTYSTLRSISFNDGRNEVLIPTVNETGTMSDDEAIGNYYRTGQHLGKFNSVNDANRFAELLHRQQEIKYGKRD